MLQPLPRPFGGVIPPVATPLTPSGALDEPAFARLVQRLRDAGVNGLFVNGTTGEGPALARPVRRRVAEVACEAAAGAAPVLVNVTEASLDDALAAAAHAAAAGASFAVLSPPFYFPLDQAALGRFVEQFAAKTALPFFLYNIPSHTRNSFELDTVRRLASLPNCYGMKDSTGDPDYFRGLLDIARDHPGFSVLMGPEERMAEAVAAGAHGGVPGGANLFPRLYVDLYRAARDGDAALVARLQEQVMTISRGVYAAGYGASTYLRGVKTALAELGICGDTMAAPLVAWQGEVRARIRATLQSLGLIA